MVPVFPYFSQTSLGSTEKFKKKKRGKKGLERKRKKKC